MGQPYGYQSPPPTYNPAVIRSVWRCFWCLFLSGGLWGFAWIYHTTKEVTPHVRQGAQSPGARAALFLIPIYNLVLLYQMFEEINDYCQRTRSQDFNVVLFFILSIFGFGFITYPLVQMRLNDAHRAATNGAAQQAPMETIDWVFVGIGIAFFVLWVLLIIVIIIAAASSN